MSILASDIEVRYSGGAANIDPLAALGGAISTAAGGTVDDNVSQDLFANVPSAEQASGSTKYRGIYAKNIHGSLTLQDARLYLTSQAELAIGLAVEAVNVTMATIVNETTAPTSVTFTTPATYAAGLQFNSTTGLAPAAFRGFWVRRTIAASATPGTRSTETLNVEGATL